MKPTLFITLFFLCFAAGNFARAQQTFRERFSAHNATMSALQPAFPTPLVEADPRLNQYYRFSFSNQYTTAGTQTVNYGNARGGGIIAFNRVEVDVSPPPFVQHNSAALDGFGDTSVSVKLRMFSANANHGNYILTAIGGHTFATGSAKNGAATDAWTATLAGGKGITKKLDIDSSLGATLPTGMISSQGRTITWSAMMHDHVTRSVWVELESNASFFRGGSHDGMTQDFVTPGAFYIFRPKEWRPTHPFLVFAGGMQIATTRFHTYNHNTIAEMRVMF